MHFSLRNPIAALCAAAMLFAGACSRENNVLMGQVETDMGGHHVVVTNCRQFFGTPKPTKYAATSYRYAPCKGSVVVIQGDTLFVNGLAQGTLAPGDTVVVDEGKVKIHGK
ncbi:MAG: hypothetical protein ABIQ97_06745 [Lysobacteraceae bacterium]